MVITDFNTGKVMDNDVEVGFVKENWTLDETPLSESDKSKLSTGDMIITPYVISPPYEGYGGGMYKYMRSYVTGFSFLSYAAVNAVVLALAAKSIAYIHSLYSEPNANTFLKDAFTGFISYVLAHFFVNRNYYVKVYDTGVVTVNGHKYRRAALEYYNDSSYTSYLKTEWADGYISGT